MEPVPAGRLSGRGMERVESEEAMVDRLREELHRFNLNVEKMKLGQYVTLLEKPGRLLYVNFLGGLGRGVGIAVGFTILGALVLYLLQRLLLLHLPVISGYIAEMIQLVRLKLGY